MSIVFRFSDHVPHSDTGAVPGETELFPGLGMRDIVGGQWAVINNQIKAIAVGSSVFYRCVTNATVKETKVTAIIPNGGATTLLTRSAIVARTIYVSTFDGYAVVYDTLGGDNYWFLYSLRDFGFTGIGGWAFFPAPANGHSLRLVLTITGTDTVTIHYQIFDIDNAEASLLDYTWTDTAPSDERKLAGYAGVSYNGGTGQVFSDFILEDLAVIDVTEDEIAPDSIVTAETVPTVGIDASTTIASDQVSSAEVVPTTTVEAATGIDSGTIPTSEAIPPITIDASIGIEPGPIPTVETVPPTTIDGSTGIGIEPIPTGEVVPSPDVGERPTINVDSIPTVETVPVPDLGGSVTIATGTITHPAIVPSPGIVPIVSGLPSEVVGGLIGRSMVSDVYKSVFPAKLQAGVSDKVLALPYATIESAGGRGIGASTNRYKLSEDLYVVTVTGRDLDEIGRAWAAFETTFGKFAMKGKRNRIQLKYGEIYHTDIESERISPSTEYDKYNQLTRWKKANLFVRYTKRFQGV